MATSVKSNNNSVLYAVHPLDDVPEEKCSVEGKGLLHMSRSVKASLVTLRIYLLLILALSVYRLVDLLGLFGHHATK